MIFFYLIKLIGSFNSYLKFTRNLILIKLIKNKLNNNINILINVFLHHELNRIIYSFSLTNFTTIDCKIRT
jgi:hypothetical protein